MSRHPNPLGFDPAKLSLPSLASTFDALTTLQNVTVGLMESGQFEGDSDSARPAYDMMDEVRRKFGEELCAVRDEAERRECASPADAAAKFNILLMASAWGGERECEVVAILAKAVSDMEWQVAHSGRAES
jgi:hypothetical protein